MIYRGTFLFACLILISAQPLPAPTGFDAGILTDHARQFVEIYGLATKLMNLGGSIINSAKDVYDFTGRDRSGWSGNSLSDDFTGQRYQSGGRSRYQPSSASEYGGGALGNSFGMVQSAKQSGIETLLNTFLGPAFLGQTTQPPAINLANFFKPNYHKNEDYLATGASNIDRLINVLTKSGAQRATPSPSQNLLQNLFGKR